MTHGQRRAGAFASAAVGAAALLACHGAPASGDEGTPRLERLSARLHAHDLTVVGRRAFFTTNTEEHGSSLWSTDGTPGGTTLVKDLQPGPGGGGHIYDLTPVGGLVYFSAYGADKGRELWRSDGSPGGTVLIKDIATEGSSNPLELTNLDGILYFIARDDVHGFELWRSDGTRSGTRLVKDIVAGPFGSEPDYLTAFDGRLFFTADDGSGDRDLWKSDGTSAGTVLVKDIGPNDGHYGETKYQPSQLTPVGGELFFVADDDVHGPGLWKTDGSPRGTVLVKDTTPGNDPTGYFDHPIELVRVRNRLFFAAHDQNGEELWVSDGTSAGTRMVKDIHPGPGSGLAGTTDPRWLPNLTAVGDDLFFTADDDVHGRELWKTDGTANGTVRLSLLPDSPRYSYYLPHQVPVRKLTRVGSTLYFIGRDHTRGQQIWSSDGTRAGTVRVTNLLGDLDHGYISAIAAFRGTLLFSSFNRIELAIWKTVDPGRACQGVAVTATGSGEITGTRGDDVILGSPSADVIDGRGGADIICGGGGNDTLVGGRGNDRLYGGRGNDRINTRDGRHSNDFGSGGRGKDVAHADPDDFIVGVT
ncbi:ELWxxDGT repeat protein [Nocardioides pelophilus]|uniref:ELWxxDGT repeat protein n=1 Tax=Nocardioides pelophilus TaxID=2172019 RepID=UPI0015FF7DA1|nr:ELWxxDGT repeat protein [Nocardioides pelophilus]